MIRYLYSSTVFVLLVLSGCKCICMDAKTPHDVSKLYGTYSVEITKCPWRISKADVMVKLKEKMGTHLADSSDAWNVGDGQVVDLEIKITDTENEHILPLATLCIPSCWTLCAIPLFRTIDHNVVCEIECAGMAHNASTEIEETRIFSSQPWSYMPILWHDIGSGFDENRSSWDENQEMNSWFADKVAESIAATLTREFYIKATGGNVNE